MQESRYWIRVMNLLRREYTKSKEWRRKKLDSGKMSFHDSSSLEVIKSMPPKYAWGGRIQDAFESEKRTSARRPRKQVH